MGVIFFAYADGLHFRCSRPSCLGCSAEAWLIHTAHSKQRLRSTSRLGRGSTWIFCMAMTILCLDKLLYYWNTSCQSPIHVYFPPYLRFFLFFFFNVLWSSAWLPHNSWGILICPGKTGLAWAGRWYKKSPGQKPASNLCLEKRAARRGMCLEKITLSGLQAALGFKLNSLRVDRSRDWAFLL